MIAVLLIDNLENICPYIATNKESRKLRSSNRCSPTNTPKTSSRRTVLLALSKWILSTVGHGFTRTKKTAFSEYDTFLFDCLQKKRSATQPEEAEILDCREFRPYVYTALGLSCHIKAWLPVTCFQSV